MWKSGKRDQHHKAHRPLSNIMEVDTVSTNEIISQLRQLRELQALIEEAETEAEAIKDAIKAHMGDAEELRAGEYKVTYKAVESSRVDTAALRRAMPDVAAAFTKRTKIRRFCVV